MWFFVVCAIDGSALWSKAPLDHATPAPGVLTRVLVSNMVNARRCSQCLYGDDCDRGAEPSEQVTGRIVFILNARGVDGGETMDRRHERARTVEIMVLRLVSGLELTPPFDDVCSTDMLAA